MGVHELLPSSLLLAFWSWDDARFIEDIGDGSSADVNAKPDADGISYLCVAPLRLSLAIANTNLWVSPGLRGRPGPLRDLELSYFSE